MITILVYENPEFDGTNARWIAIIENIVKPGKKMHTGSTAQDAVNGALEMVGLSPERQA